MPLGPGRDDPADPANHIPDPTGCGCTSGGVSAGLLFALAAILRRRA